MSKGHLLIIDDEEQLRKLLGRLLALEGYTIYEAGNIKSAYKILDKEEIHVVLSDVKLPDGNGVELVQQLRAKYPATEIIVLTAYGNIADGVQAIKSGAFDYITKGDDNNRILPLVSKAMEQASLRFRIRDLERQIGGKYSFDSILGESPEIKAAVALAEKVAPSDLSVLLLGETGAGKEVFAQAIHQGSQRKQYPFVAVNCSAFGREILESELFGHVPGAFTGAIKEKKGFFEEAKNGTIFLDEIGEMALELQAKLLRVLETQEFYKVGEAKPTKTNVRIIAATNRNLESEIANGHFRADLFYRLSAFQINIPSLNERRKDIPLLASWFLKQIGPKINKRRSNMTPAFIEALQQHNWKGNIRELRNVIERAAILTDTDVLDVHALPLDFKQDGQQTTSSLLLADVEKQHIIKVLALEKGNKTRAAEVMGIGLTTLYNKIKEYHIQLS
ncbi:DNA-binding transcriptional response regulator, NtrC family, contains REC, AAA-type ATPase, and a Fis-type DNA-binding domains [Chitinophaga terrae (ex Kim and Jung 2007)]|uniref:DNA-binding transcriptional response regulator, NtrC family, contains REC, AAA-type ATPase, and a Fis-type DNA-binding domains n=1 Tax=Chitinophaga terrae (ex Kim and Jung 2007) TaxID=408074 RepID=A0A1H3XS09_9BACT|nr:sigma-54 dependent transcriptional regulator [Chitinophaga terrae (ex Kim and Jung 2007)]GEP89357.1 sigma-54-dependent Fis family transcriptional regulator [Chitinophaga terrae (ex Kim and Jung 2007)]SEA02199.1 DNA-binding transcriptional response regulator, NtrC family, contains REC, AAA-type ATPase, and a Fis-type DNA-binding domains [Chitinophaga terrae (ex Kim and Jung 2007)]